MSEVIKAKLAWLLENPMALKDFRMGFRDQRFFNGLIASFALLVGLTLASFLFEDGGGGLGRLWRRLFLGQLLLVSSAGPILAAKVLKAELNSATFDEFRVTILSSTELLLGKLFFAGGWVVLVLCWAIPLEFIPVYLGSVSLGTLLMSKVWLGTAGLMSMLLALASIANSPKESPGLLGFMGFAFAYFCPQIVFYGQINLSVFFMLAFFFLIGSWLFWFAVYALEPSNRNLKIKSFFAAASYLCLPAFCCYGSLSQASWAESAFGFLGPLTYLMVGWVIDRDAYDQLSLCPSRLSRHRTASKCWVLILAFGLFLPLAAFGNFTTLYIGLYCFLAALCTGSLAHVLNRIRGQEASAKVPSVFTLMLVLNAIPNLAFRVGVQIEPSWFPGSISPLAFSFYCFHNSPDSFPYLAAIVYGGMALVALSLHLYLQTKKHARTRGDQTALKIPEPD